MAGSGGKYHSDIAQRVVVCFLLLALLVSGLAWSVPIEQAEAKDSAYVVIDVQHKRVLSASNAYARLPMASTTKIATAITVLERANLDDKLTVSSRAAGTEGSSIYLKAGEQWRVEDLLYGLMLRSGNDAAVALAEGVGGDIEAFADMMNHTACRAGAYSTHFVNPHGLHSDDHYTTAYDLAAITAYALHNPTFAEIVSTRSHTYVHPDGDKRVFVNKNKMLTAYPGADGVKTGYTTKAGRCLVTSATRDGMQLVAVVLNVYDMWQVSARLLDQAFSAFRDVVLWQAGEVKLVPVADSRIPAKVNVTLSYPLSEQEVGRLVYEYHTDSTAIGRGEAKIGEVLIRLDGKVLAQAPLYRQ